MIKQILIMTTFLWSATEIEIGSFYYKNHWTDDANNSLLWNSKSKLSNTYRPPQTLQGVYYKIGYDVGQFNIAYQGGYHHNTVDDYVSGYRSGDKVRNDRKWGWEEHFFKIAYSHKKQKFQVYLTTPWGIKEAGDVADFGDAEAWNGFGVYRIGYNWESYAGSHWWMLENAWTTFAGEYPRVESGGFELKAFYYYGWFKGNWGSISPGLWSLYSEYEWKSLSEGSAVSEGAMKQKDLQIEGHLVYGFPMPKKYSLKIDFGITLYSYSNTEFLNQGITKSTDATRQISLILSLSSKFE